MLKAETQLGFSHVPLETQLLGGTINPRNPAENTEAFVLREAINTYGPGGTSETGFGGEENIYVSRPDNMAADPFVDKPRKHGYHHHHHHRRRRPQGFHATHSATTAERRRQNRVGFHERSFPPRPDQNQDRTPTLLSVDDHDTVQSPVPTEEKSPEREARRRRWEDAPPQGDHGDRRRRQPGPVRGRVVPPSRPNETKTRRRPKKKKPATKKIFHRGIWMTVPAAGNRGPARKARKKRRRRRRPAPDTAANDGAIVVHDAAVVVAAPARPEWDSSPLLRKRDEGKQPERDPSPRSRSPDRRARRSRSPRSAHRSRASPTPVVREVGEDGDAFGLDLNSTMQSKTEAGDEPLRSSVDPDESVRLSASFAGSVASSVRRSHESRRSGSAARATPSRTTPHAAGKGRSSTEQLRADHYAGIKSHSVEREAHSLPFTPANAVTRGKRLGSGSGGKGSSQGGRSVGKRRNVNLSLSLDSSNFEDVAASTAAAPQSVPNASLRARSGSRSGRARKSARTPGSATSATSRRRASPFGRSSRASPSSSKRQPETAAYEKARVEVEKLVKAQKAYLESQAKMTLEEIQAQQRAPNQVLDSAVHGVERLRTQLFPLIREAEDALERAQSRARKSHFVYNSTLIGALARRSAAVIGDNIDTLVDAILDDVLEDTVDEMDQNEAEVEQWKRAEEHPAIIAEALNAIAKIEQDEQHITHQISSRLVFESETNPLLKKTNHELVAGGHGVPIDVEGGATDRAEFRALAVDESRTAGRSGEAKRTEKCTFTWQQAQNIEEGRNKYDEHRRQVEAPLLKTGFQQYQLIELLEKDLVTDVLLDVAGEFDSIMADAAENLMNNA